MVDRTNPIRVSTFHAYVNSVGRKRAMYASRLTGTGHSIGRDGIRFEGGVGICIV